MKLAHRPRPSYLVGPDLWEFTSLEELLEISLVHKGEDEEGTMVVVYTGSQDGVHIGVDQTLEETRFTHD